MNVVQLTKLSKELFTLNDELIQFAESCINHIYKDEPNRCRRAIYEFHNMINYYDDMGCLNNIDYLMKRAES